MLLRSISGLGIGALSGAMIGAITFGIYDYVHALHIGLTSRWSFTALAGFLYLGVLGGFIGLVVGVTRVNKIYGAIIGLILGLFLALLSYERGLGEILILSALDLSLVSLIVSTFTKRIFASNSLQKKQSLTWQASFIN